jgi:hypothetical protein
MTEKDRMCERCGGTGLVRGEPRGQDGDGNQLYVWWQCDCGAKAWWETARGSFSAVPEVGWEEID